MSGYPAQLAPLSTGHDSLDQIDCRLCGGLADRAFSLIYLKHIPVGLYLCATCGSLETSPPDWLDEAYADARPVRDVWMAGRTEGMRALTLLVIRALGLKRPRLFDWGGGNGLLVRMLRDAGIDAYRSDKYVPNYYAVGFDVEDSAKAEMMTAFEVFEHSDNPRLLMTEMTAHAPDTILLSTDIYQGQGADWSYIHKDSGKHVFFYSEKGLIMLAEQFGYRCVTAPKFTLMHKQPLGKGRAMAVRQLLKRFGTQRRWPRILESAIVRSRPGANRDFEDLMRRGML
jgi:hypothetical protein